MLRWHRNRPGIGPRKVSNKVGAQDALRDIVAVFFDNLVY